MGENDKKEQDKKTDNVCPLHDLMNEGLQKVISDIAELVYVNIKDGKGNVEPMHVSEVLSEMREQNKQLLESVGELKKANATKLKLMQTEKIWKGSKWIINTGVFFKWAFKAIAVPVIIGLLLSIAISYYKMEEHMKKIDTLEQQFINHLGNH